MWNIIAKTFIRICNLMLYPAKEWTAIADENNSRKTIYRQFVVPLLCLITVATIIGTWLVTPRELYSVGYVCYIIALMWISLSAGLYISAFVITEIMALQTGSRDHDRAFALMAYSFGAAYAVILLVALFPFFSEMLVLMLYSFYLYWRGIPHLIRVQDQQKQIIYGLMSAIIVGLTYLLMFFLFGKVLREWLVVS